MKKVETLLKKLGLKPEAITALIADDDASNVDELAGVVQTSVRSTVTNDPEFLQPIRDQIRGEERSKMEHKIKKVFALSPDEIKDKKFDEIVEVAHTKIRNTASSSSEELQTKLTELARENKRLIEEVIPAKETEAAQKIKVFQRDNILRSKLASQPLLVDHEVIYPALMLDLEKDLNFDVAENGELVVTTKDGLKPLKADKTGTMTVEEILNDRLNKFKVLKKSNADPNQPVPPRTPIPGSTPNPTFNLPGMDAAKQNVEEMKNLRTFGQ